MMMTMMGFQMNDLCHWINNWTSNPTTDWDGDGCHDLYEDDDDDNDGVLDLSDVCSQTPLGKNVNSDGCADDDLDGVVDSLDLCHDGISLWTSNATTDYDFQDSDSWIFAEIINSGSANQVASVATDGEGNTIIAGRYYGTLTLGSHSITNPSTSYSLFIAKFASDGTWDWLKGAGGSSNNAPVTQAESVAINNEGDIFVTGHFTDTMFWYDKFDISWKL